MSNFQTLSDSDFRDELFLKNSPASWKMKHLVELERRGTDFLNGEEKVITDDLIRNFKSRISTSVKPISDELEKQKHQLARRLAQFKLDIPKIESPTFSTLVGTSPENENLNVSESVDLMASIAQQSAQHQKAQSATLLQILDVLSSTQKAQLPRWVGWVTLILVLAGTVGQIVPLFR
jgi:hypothetical protein